MSLDKLRDWTWSIERISEEAESTKALAGGLVAIEKISEGAESIKALAGGLVAFFLQSCRVGGCLSCS